MKVTTIELISENGLKKDFTIEHATRLLGLTRSAWTISEESEFQYTKENGINKKSYNTGNNRQKEIKNNRSGNNSTEQD